jgi:hypothetical protein
MNRLLRVLSFSRQLASSFLAVISLVFFCAACAGAQSAALRAAATSVDGAHGLAVDPFTITTISLPEGVDGEAFSAQLASKGGTGKVTWKLSTGSGLVNGLTLSSAGKISGKPTASTDGAGSFKVVATDSARPVHTVNAKIAYIINPEDGDFRITTTELANAMVGAPYSASLKSSGGVGAVTYKLIDRTTLPAGLTVSVAGKISGKPTKASTGPDFWVQAADSSKPKAKTVTAYLGIVVEPAAVSSLKVETANLPGATVDTSYSATLKATGGITPYMWSIAAGSRAPGGLTLAASGLLTGKPTTSSGDTPTSFVVEVKDSTAHTAKGTVSIQINPATNSTPLTVNSTIAPGYVDADYLADILVTGGTPPYTYSGESRLPEGLFLKSDGAVYGIPQQQEGETSFTIKVTDSSQPARAVTTGISMNIYAAPSQCTPTGSSSTTLAWLKGAYSFETEDVDLAGSGKLSGILGILTADGKGNVSGGFYDWNSPYFTGEMQGTFSGTYAIGASGRGIVNLTLPVDGLNVNHAYCIALDSMSGDVAGAGQMIEADTSDIIAHGRFYALGSTTPSPSSLKGTWVFGLQGNLLDANFNMDRTAIAGFVTLDGAGHVTAGQWDYSADETGAGGVLTNEYQAAVPLSGSYTMASSGRGIINLQADTPNGPQELDFITYVAGPNKILLLTANADYDENIDAFAPIVEGIGILSTGATFTNSDLNGPSIITSQGLSVDTGNDLSYGRLVQAGIWTWDGNGNLSGSEDKNSAGSVVTALQDSIKATYKVDSNGYATLTPTNVETAPNFYLVGANDGFGVQANNSVNLYRLEDQIVPSGGYTATSIQGTFSRGSLWFSYADQTAESGIAAVNNSAANFAYDMDENSQGVIQIGQSSTVTYQANANGRFQTPATGVAGSAIYFVSPQKAYAIDLNSDSAFSTLFELNFFQ